MDRHREKENGRKLSKAEQKRRAKFEQLKAELEAQGYVEHDLTIGLVYANVMAIVLGLPVSLLFIVAFLWRRQSMEASVGLADIVLFYVLLVVLICVHELIHGITWAIFAPSHWKTVEFGFIKEYLTPYCTCGEPLKKWQYIIGALMPTILLGTLPAFIAVCTGSWMLLILGIALIFGGGGDLTIVLELLRHRSAAREVVYIDHPYAAGVVAFERM
ncbi:DUF3267 domain-containing protein [Butyricicoccus sp.]|uniref:DUF3267 domain-containing protein n=1 Tax=Butyricicoccus sp. TaxID=2049021 RepID=UPI003F14ED8F